MTGKQGQLLSAGNTTSTQVVLTDLLNKPGQYNFFIKVVSGTIKFGVGGADSNQHGWTSSDTVVPIVCENGDLYVLQGTNGDTFVIGASQLK